jgi:hypothetical protein
MIRCIVTAETQGYVVSFRDQTSLLLQSDYEYVAFAVNCGLIPAPDDWDGDPRHLRVKYWEYNISGIVRCPEEYHKQASY